MKGLLKKKDPSISFATSEKLSPNTLGPGLGSGDGNSDLHKIWPNLSLTLSFFFFEAMIAFN